MQSQELIERTWGMSSTIRRSNNNREVLSGHVGSLCLDSSSQKIKSLQGRTICIPFRFLLTFCFGSPSKQRDIYQGFRMNEKSFSPLNLQILRRTYWKGRLELKVKRDLPQTREWDSQLLSPSLSLFSECKSPNQWIWTWFFFRLLFGYFQSDYLSWHFSEYMTYMSNTTKL